MSERDDTLRDQADRTIDDVVSEKQRVLEATFGLAPETAHATAEDSVASRMRQPSSDAKEAERIEDAKSS
jgi:hypothetical protein